MNHKIFYLAEIIFLFAIVVPGVEVVHANEKGDVHIGISADFAADADMTGAEIILIRPAKFSFSSRRGYQYLGLGFKTISIDNFIQDKTFLEFFGRWQSGYRYSPYIGFGLLADGRDALKFIFHNDNEPVEDEYESGGYLDIGYHSLLTKEFSIRFSYKWLGIQKPDGRDISVNTAGISFYYHVKPF